MSKKGKREVKKLRRLLKWIPKKWRVRAMAIGILIMAYIFFLTVSSLFSGGNSDTYIEVFVGDWMKGTNDSRTLPIVFDVMPTSQTLQDVSLPSENVISLGPNIGVSNYIPNCGLPEPCGSTEFAVHIYTGKDHNDHPMLCVDGKYVIGSGTVVGGRGINLAIIDVLTRTVTQIRNFDTYVQESTQLETLLLTLRPGDIIIMLTFDEPTKKLSRVARLLFHDLGSSMSQNLQYRAGWYLVTQKGIDGFTPYEGLNLVDSDGWPTSHDQRFCVPTKLVGERIHPDPLPRVNSQRNSFCQRHPVFPGFCDGDVINDGLQPAAALRSGIAGSDIFNLPIIVMTGTVSNLKYLPATLETILRQPGVNPKNVVVYYLPQHPEVAELTELFGFMSEELTCTSTPCVHALEAFQTTSLLFPDADYVIYIEENIVLCPDFFTYLGQLLPLLRMDQNLDSISAYNENGFDGVSGEPTVMHRTDVTSGLALVIRKKAISKNLCTNRTRQEWLFKGLSLPGEALVPDLSRVIYVPIIEEDDSEITSLFHKAILNRKRETSLLSEIRIPHLNLLTKEEYDQSVSQDLAKSQVFRLESERLDQCLVSNIHQEPNKGISILAPDLEIHNCTRQVLMFSIEQESVEDFSLWYKIASCLGLFAHPYLPPRNLYNGTIRFTWATNKVYLVSTLSKFSPFQNLKNDTRNLQGQIPFTIHNL